MERDDESGKYIEKYSDKEFIKSVKEVKTSTTQNIADRVGCSYDLAYRRLNTLEDEGILSSTEIGGCLLWSIE
jgi:ribosomal protein S25